MRLARPLPHWLMQVSEGRAATPLNRTCDAGPAVAATEFVTDPGPARVVAFVLIGAVLLATLVPVKEWNDGNKQLLCVLCGGSSLSDVFGNVILYIPVGAILTLNGFGIVPTVLAAALTSCIAEVLQLWIPGRDSSFTDVLCNITGAATGYWVLRGSVGRHYIHAVEDAITDLVRPSPLVASMLSLSAASIAILTFVATGALLKTTLPNGPFVVGASALKSTSLPLRIGGNTDARDFFIGLLDEVRIYNRPKTATEIRADVSTPVGLGGVTQRHTADLVAAYGSDDQVSEILVDDSGRGNNGELVGPRWVPDGRFGRALRFDGHDVVVVPSSEGLNLSTGMTVEAWVCPTAIPRGWANVVQKDVDSYFLTASSDGGPLRPAAGGTFGGLLLNIQAPASVPLNQWTHLATTYDGSTLRLYVNGDQVASRTVWVPSRQVALSIGDVAVPPGSVPNSDQVRSHLAKGDAIRLSARLEPGGLDGPIVGLYDRHQGEVLSIGRAGPDLVFRQATRAAAWGLEVPDLRLHEALPRVSAADALRVTIARRNRDYCIEVNGRTSCGIGYTIGDGWAVMVHSQTLPSPIRVGLSSLWLGVLAFPPGFWATRRVRWISLLAILAGAILLPRLLGLLATPGTQLTATIGGWSFGWLCRAHFVGRI